MAMSKLPRPQNWPEGLPVPDAWIRFDHAGNLDSQGWTSPPANDPRIIEGGFSFTRALSVDERTAIEQYLLAVYRIADHP